MGGGDGRGVEGEEEAVDEVGLLHVEVERGVVQVQVHFNSSIVTPQAKYQYGESQSLANYGDLRRLSSVQWYRLTFQVTI